jgi:DNA-binding ferritin-like protein
MDRIGKIIGLLMMSRTMAHKAHLKTGSYAKHKALNRFYDDVVDLLDELAEASQGKYGLIEVVDMDEKGDIEDPVAMLESHLKMYQNLTKSIDDRFLQGISDEIEALYYSTLYKLKHLN